VSREMPGIRAPLAAAVSAAQELATWHAMLAGMRPLRTRSHDRGPRSVTKSGLAV
jgi:hypothetical protein